MDNVAYIENLIFDLRKRADLFLQAGDTAAVARIENTIAHLQQVHGVTAGVERKTDPGTVDGEREGPAETKVPMSIRDRIERTIFYLRSAESLFLTASDTGSFDEIRELIADLELQKQTLEEVNHGRANITQQ